MKYLLAGLLAAMITTPLAAKDFPGFYRMQTQFQAPENKCFEGSRVDPALSLGGAARMDDCQNVTGQLWIVIPAGQGRYRLSTAFQMPEGKCLEGNKFDRSSALGGAAFLDDCQNVSGQLWKFEPAGNGWYKLKTVFQGNNKCLEGNKFDPASTLGGAAFMDNCQNVSGQLWKFVPAGN